MRTGWDDKSPSYRARLVGAGRSGKLSGSPMSPEETRTYWEAGGDLRAGRSHQPSNPYAAPAGPRARAAEHLDTTADYAALQRWRTRHSPPWLPRSEAIMGTDVAAILSTISIPPSRWRAVDIVGQADGTAIMTVTPRSGYPQVVRLPDRDAISEVTSFIRNPVPDGATDKERKRLESQWAKGHPRVSVTGTDQARKGMALPDGGSSGPRSKKSGASKSRAGEGSVSTSNSSEPRGRGRRAPARPATKRQTRKTASSTAKASGQDSVVDVLSRQLAEARAAIASQAAQIEYLLEKLEGR